MKSVDWVICVFHLFQVFVTIKNKKENKKHNLVVKQAIPAKTASDAKVMETTYFNEIHFYKTVWPTYDNFQRSFPGITYFNKIATCYGSNLTPGREKLILENLKHSGFQMFPRDGAFQDAHLKLLLNAYGRFHGISAAFRELHPEETKKLTEVLTNSSELVLKMNVVSMYIVHCLKSMEKMIENENIKGKLEVFRQNAIQLASDSIHYGGRNPVFNHGDCWSNNILFKFDVSIFSK